MGSCGVSRFVVARIYVYYSGRGCAFLPTEGTHQWSLFESDKIFASYGSIIGSIGVSGPSWFYYNNPTSISSGILGETIVTKNGIEVFNQNAGQGKDLFNPYRRPKNEEIKHLQNIVDLVLLI